MIFDVSPTLRRNVLSVCLSSMLKIDINWEDSSLRFIVQMAFLLIRTTKKSDMNVFTVFLLKQNALTSVRFTRSLICFAELSLEGDITRCEGEITRCVCVQNKQTDIPEGHLMCRLLVEKGVNL